MPRRCRPWKSYPWGLARRSAGHASSSSTCEPLTVILYASYVSSSSMLPVSERDQATCAFFRTNALKTVHAAVDETLYT